MRSSSASSSTSAPAPDAAESVGCAAARPGSIHVRYALLDDLGVGPQRPAPLEHVPRHREVAVVVVHLHHAPAGCPLRERWAQSASRPGRSGAARRRTARPPCRCRPPRPPSGTLGRARHPRSRGRGRARCRRGRARRRNPRRRSASGRRPPPPPRRSPRSPGRCSWPCARSPRTPEASSSCRCAPRAASTPSAARGAAPPARHSGQPWERTPSETPRACATLCPAIPARDSHWAGAAATAPVRSRGAARLLPLPTVIRRPPARVREHHVAQMRQRPFTLSAGILPSMMPS